MSVFLIYCQILIICFITFKLWKIENREIGKYTVIGLEQPCTAQNISACPNLITFLFKLEVAFSQNKYKKLVLYTSFN